MWALLLLALLASGVMPGDMVAVGGGTFTPSYSLEGEEVEVNPFLLSRYPITNAQFLAFVKQHPEWRRSKVKQVFAERGYLKHWSSDLGFDAVLADRPVVNVSWFAARAYCQAQGRRLPTELEWEFAGRASETEIDASDRPPFQKRILSWYSKPNSAELSAVGTSFRNVYGAYDMHGLVWEWVEDFNSRLSSRDGRKNGQLDRDLYCAAGVAGARDPGDYAAYMRYAFRSSLKGNYVLPNLGFRCAADYE
jgi:formylglycine-generating enzyme required for sulfatase activity